MEVNTGSFGGTIWDWGALMALQWHVLEWTCALELRRARAQQIRRGVEHIVLRRKNSFNASLSINVDGNV